MAGKQLSQAFEDQLRDVVRWVKSQPNYKGGRGMPMTEPETWNVFRNNSGEEVPPFAIMEVSDVEVSSGRNRLIIVKPTGNNEKPHVVNGPRPVPDGKPGKWSWGTVKVAVDGTPTAGDQWGVSADSWKLSAAGGEEEPVMVMHGLLQSGFAMATPLATGGGEDQQYTWPGILQERAAEGASATVSFAFLDDFIGSREVLARNHTSCEYEVGTPVTVHWNSSAGYFWFTSCRCCSGDDKDCCDTKLWACICGDILVQIPVNGGTITIPDLQSCCSGTCSTSSSLTITLACSGGTITGTYDQECDGVAGSTATLNSTALTNLCDDSTEASYSFTASEIGQCNPSIEFFNYAPTDCGSSETRCSVDFSCATQVDVTIQGVGKSGYIGGIPDSPCNCDTFNDTFTCTLVGRGDGWAEFEHVLDFSPSNCVPLMEGARITVSLTCGPCDTGVSVPAAIVDGLDPPANEAWKMTILAVKSLGGTCYYHSHSICIPGVGDPCGFDSGTVPWAGLVENVSPGSAGECGMKCFYGFRFNGTETYPEGPWENVSVRAVVS